MRLPPHGEVDLIAVVAEEFALRVQYAFMGWPRTLHDPLRRWTRRDAEATRARDRDATAAVAREFDGYVRDLLNARRDAGPSAPGDATAEFEAALDALDEGTIAPAPVATRYGLHVIRLD